MLKIKELPDFVQAWRAELTETDFNDARRVFIGNYSCLVSRADRHSLSAEGKHINFDGARQIRSNLNDALRDGLMARRDLVPSPTADLSRWTPRDRAQVFIIQELCERVLSAYLRCEKLICLYKILGRQSQNDELKLPGLQWDNDFWLNKEGIE